MGQAATSHTSQMRSITLNRRFNGETIHSLGHPGQMGGRAEDESESTIEVKSKVQWDGPHREP